MRTKFVILNILQPIFWLCVGILIGNIYEATAHNVSLYDAIFIESWNKTK